MEELAACAPVCHKGYQCSSLQDLTMAGCANGCRHVQLHATVEVGACVGVEGCAHNNRGAAIQRSGKDFSMLCLTVHQKGVGQAAD